MIGIAMDKLVVFTIDMRHDRIIAMVVIGIETNIYLPLVIIQTETGIIGIIRFQVGIASFDLQGVGQLVYIT